MPKPRRSRVILVVILLLVVFGAALQFIRQPLDNPPVTGDIQAPADVKQVLERSCYSCHSNQTKLAWFDELVPAYWTVAAHVRDGRAVLNFSHWDSLPAAAQKGKLFEALNQMTFDVMPLASYRFVHRSATVTPADLAVLRAYLLTLPSPNIADTARSAAADKQYALRTSAAYTPATPSAALNGIGYPKDWENWEVLGSSDRFDNGTLRVILANPTAIQAFKNGQTNPWPDGAAFAKIAWDQSATADGVIHTGEFKQVEFMLKDATRYASTHGWGWARWVKGLTLAPYGKTAAFTSECMNCHQPMKDRDLFFSLPPAPVAPAGYTVISSSVVKGAPSSAGVTSILYGNPQAVAAARRGARYPQGAALLLATWKQKEDPHWFGANIPGTHLSTEKVTFGAGGPVYEGGFESARRVDSIVRLRASVLP
jgi:hypothetical protein